MTYSTALPLTLPSLTSDRRQQLLQNHSLLSLYEVFATIPDPRSMHGLRYELAYLLICLIAGLLCNADSTLAIAQWCRDQQALLKRLFRPRRFLCPSASLYRKLLPRLDVQQIEWALADWLRSTLVAGPEDPIALDGKTVRGARTDEQAAPHLLSFRTHQSQETLLQVAVGEKTNEIPIAQALLPCLPLAGRVCTADALHTQKNFMRVGSMPWEAKAFSLSKTISPRCMPTWLPILLILMLPSSRMQLLISIADASKSARSASAPK